MDINKRTSSEICKRNLELLNVIWFIVSNIDFGLFNACWYGIFKRKLVELLF